MAKIQSMYGLIGMTIKSVRRIAMELRPGTLDDLGLVAAIEWQAQNFQRRTGIQCELFIEDGEDIGLDKELSTALFRIFQETLTNVARHAQATKVSIRLVESTGTLRLEIEDNGKGITEEDISNPKSLGLLGIRERALLFRGDVNITGSMGKGTRISVSIPLGR
jgi:signal transduction histidine kinase